MCSTNKTDAGRCPHCDCPNKYCACVLMVRVKGAEQRESEAIEDAHRHRLLWQCAASYIAAGCPKKPRGDDEKAMLNMAKTEGPQSKFYSGKTKGWIVQNPIHDI